MLIHTTKSISIAHFVQTADEDSPCRRLHGHTVKVEVKINGKIQKDGMVMDYRHIKKIIKRLDHRTLIPDKLVDRITVRGNELSYIIDTGYNNMTLPMKDCVILDIPAITSEYLAIYLLRKIDDIIENDYAIITVKVWEGPNSYAEMCSLDMGDW